MELIDRAALLDDLRASVYKQDPALAGGIGYSVAAVEDATTIDAVEVVRCGECVHAKPIPDAKAKYFADGVKCCEILRGDETYGVSVVWDEGYCDEGKRMDADAPERAEGGGA